MLEDFIAECTAPLAPRTRENYEWARRAWETWCEERGVDPLAVTRHDLEAHIGQMQDQGYMPRAIRSRIGIIMSLYRWMHLHGLIDTNPSEHVRLPRSPQRSMRPYLSPQDAHAWVRAAEADERPIGLLVMLWLLSGMRPGEPLQLTGSDIHPWQDRLTVTLRRRKNGGGATLLLPETTAERVVSHLHGTAPLIRTVHGRAPSTHLASRWLYAWCRRHGLDYLPPYSLRVTYITLALESGADPRHVAGSADQTLAMTTYYDRLHGAVAHNPAQRMAEWIRANGTAAAA